jgi:hypothetical protein
MLDYELEFDLANQRVTVWYLDDAGQRTGSYHRIIDDGRIYIQDMDACLHHVDDPAMPLAGAFFERLYK